MYLGKTPIYNKTGNIEVVDKFSRKAVSKVSLANEDVIKEGLQKAYETKKDMRLLPSYKRKEILLQIANSLKERENELAEIITVEVGKPIKDSRVEILRAIDTFTVSAEESVRSHGSYERLDISERSSRLQGITARFPSGVVSMITPFNFPLNLAAHKIGPAIAAGCTFILKPSSKTPLSSSILGEILASTDLPDGSFSILPCIDDHAHLFSTDDRINVLSFTGSTEVGWNLKRNSNKKKVLLEMGGNAAVIIDDDVDDLDDIAGKITFGAFYSQGQSCISVQRVYAHKNIFDELVEKVKSRMKELKVGDPLDESTFIGPLISENDALRVEEWINEAKEKNAIVLEGGKRDGSFIYPTLLTNVDESARIHCDEVFGPVMIIEKVDDFNQGIELVNRSKYGLQAGIFTRDLNKTFYAFNNLDVGGVVVNDSPAVRVDSQPYGGVKDSGFGREGVRYSIEEMTELKIMVMRNIGESL